MKAIALSILLAASALATEKWIVKSTRESIPHGWVKHSEPDCSKKVVSKICKIYSEFQNA